MNRLRKIDVLVNNAGVAGMNVPTLDYPIEEWGRVMRVNLTSQILCCSRWRWRSVGTRR